MSLKIIQFIANYSNSAKLLDKQMADEDFGVDIQKIDIMSNVGLASTYGVKTLPCILLLKDGVEVDRLQGNIPLRLITEMINRHS
jgi:thioredoxin-like negative regulator of GroEL